jgi:hypothetical protein
MKRIAVYLTVVVFVMGMLVIPALHRITGCEGGNRTSDTCAICKLSHTPMEGVSSQVACADIPFRPSVHTAPPLTAFRAALTRDAKQPRAPPFMG